MDFANLLAPIALIGILVVAIHWVDDPELWPPPAPSRFDLGWPRGVQEEEPVRWRTNLARPIVRRPHG
jgi:hypothetical protein